MNIFKLELGSKVKDIISGYKGIIVARSEWVTGCKRYGVQAEACKDSKPIDEQWFDEVRLELMSLPKKIKVSTQPTGGPQKESKQPIGR